MKSEYEFATREDYLGYLQDYYAGLAVSVFSIGEREAKLMADGVPVDHESAAKLCVGFANALIAELYPNEKPTQ